MLFRTFCFSVAVFAVVVTQLSAQVPKMSEEDMKAVRAIAAEASLVQRMAYDRKIADQLELLPDQKRQIQLVIQKNRDEMLKLRSGGTAKFDSSAYRKSAEGMMEAVHEILEGKQSKKLKEMVAENAEKTRSSNYDPEQMKEMTKLRGTMTELQRLSYDRSLAESLELTPEQKVDIRETMQSYSVAMQEARKNNNGSFDVQSMNDRLRDVIIEAEGILTGEQAEKLQRSANLKSLKRKHGDEFGMVIGLAADFGLSDKETEKLNKEVEAAREAYYEGIKQLREKTLERIVKKVPSKHRDEVREAVEEFPLPDPRKRTSPFMLSR